MINTVKEFILLYKIELSVAIYLVTMVYLNWKDKVGEYDERD